MYEKPKILVAGKEPDELDLISHALTQMGGDPKMVDSGQAAAELLNREKFDGVFVDFELDNRTGLELVEKVRWSASNSRCPIVMITRTHEPGVLKQCFRAGVNFFLEKPVTREQLRILFNATRGIMLQERRRYQRVAITIPVFCEWSIQSLSQAARGESIDLSATGMLVKLDLTPPSEGVVQLRFNLPGDRHPFDLTARVASLRDSQLVGFTFAGLPEGERQRLMAFTDLVRRGSAQVGSE